MGTRDVPLVVPCADDDDDDSLPYILVPQCKDAPTNIHKDRGKRASVGCSRYGATGQRVTGQISAQYFDAVNKTSRGGRSHTHVIQRSDVDH